MLFAALQFPGISAAFSKNYNRKINNKVSWHFLTDLKFVKFLYFCFVPSNDTMSWLKSMSRSGQKTWLALGLESIPILFHVFLVTFLSYYTVLHNYESPVVVLTAFIIDTQILLNWWELIFQKYWWDTLNLGLMYDKWNETDANPWIPVLTGVQMRCSLLKNCA